MEKLNIDLSNVRDVHEEPASISVIAGITNLKTIINIRDFSLEVLLDILVETNKRGVHMSRLIEGIRLNNNNNDYIENILRNACKTISEKLNSKCIIRASFSYPLNYSDQFLDVNVEVNNYNDTIKYTFKKIGITACPCSKELTNIGHMQRAVLTVELESNEILDFNEVAKKIDECFSASPLEYLKRIDEAELVIKSQENPKFVEDVVRECLKKFPNANKITVNAFESIHTHDAYAEWSKNNRI
jgi:GTP cyclohydrolase FolE2